MFYLPNGVLWPTLAAIDAAFRIGLPFDDINNLEVLSNGFYEHSGGILDGCVMAIVGFEISTRQPYACEVEWPKDYRFCKGGFAIIALVGCDINAHFIAVLCDHSGSTHDIIAWPDTKLYELLEVKKLLPLVLFGIILPGTVVLLKHGVQVLSTIQPGHLNPVSTPNNMLAV